MKKLCIGLLLCLIGLATSAREDADSVKSNITSIEKSVNKFLSTIRSNEEKIKNGQKPNFIFNYDDHSLPFFITQTENGGSIKFSTSDADFQSSMVSLQQFHQDTKAKFYVFHGRYFIRLLDERKDYSDVNWDRLLTTEQQKEESGLKIKSKTLISELMKRVRDSLIQQSPNDEIIIYFFTEVVQFTSDDENHYGAAVMKSHALMDRTQKKLIEKNYNELIGSFQSRTSTLVDGLDLSDKEYILRGISNIIAFYKNGGAVDYFIPTSDNKYESDFKAEEVVGLKNLLNSQLLKPFDPNLKDRKYIYTEADIEWGKFDNETYLQLLEEKLNVLQTNGAIDMYVVVKNVPYLVEKEENWNKLAQEVFNASELKNKPNGVLVIIPWYKLSVLMSQYAVSGSIVKKFMWGVYSKNTNILPGEANLIEEGMLVKNGGIFDYAFSVYKNLPKPYNLYEAYIPADETIEFYEYHYSERLRNLPAVNNLIVRLDKYNLSAISRAKAEFDPLGGLLMYDGPSYYSKIARVRINSLLSDRQTWNIHFSLLKESKVPSLYKSYTSSYVQKEGFATEVATLVGLNSISKNDLYNFDIDKIIYAAIDGLEIIPGIGEGFSLVGTIYASAKGDYIKSALYAAGTIPLVHELKVFSTIGRYSKKVRFLVTSSTNELKILEKGSDEFMQFVKSGLNIADEEIATTLANREFIEILFEQHKANELKKILEGGLTDIQKQTVVNNYIEQYAVKLDNYRSIDDLIASAKNSSVSNILNNWVTEFKIQQSADFIADFTKLADQGMDLSKADVGLINAWVFVYDEYPQARSRLKLLEGIRWTRNGGNFKLKGVITQIKNRTTDVNFSTADEFLMEFFSKHKGAGTKCQECVNNIEHDLENFRNFIEDAELMKATNSIKVLDEMFQTDLKFAGGAWGLQLLRDKPPYFAGKRITGFEGSIDAIIDGDHLNCRFDLILESSSSEGTLQYFVEFKNWKRLERITFDEGFKNQFLSYISKIDDMEQLAYFFKYRNANTTVEKVKESFQVFFENNAKSMLETMNSALKAKLGITNVTSVNEFIEEIIQPIEGRYSKLYNFIR